MEKTIRNMINQQNDNLIFLTTEKNEKLSYGEFKDFFAVLSENKFRLDISSTILRNDYNSAKDKFAA